MHSDDHYTQIGNITFLSETLFETHILLIEKTVIVMVILWQPKSESSYVFKTMF